MMLTGVLLVVIAATALTIHGMRATVTDGLVVVALMSATFHPRRLRPGRLMDVVDDLLDEWEAGWRIDCERPLPLPPPTPPTQSARQE